MEKNINETVSINDNWLKWIIIMIILCLWEPDLIDGLVWLMQNFSK